jgi:hypothetical protein
MSIEILLILGLVYLLLSLVLSGLGRYKKIGSVWLFLISLLATPIIGYIVLLCSENAMVQLESRYKCPVCHFEFTEIKEFCPFCIEKGSMIELEEVDRNMI